jgi:hypothetical protein
MRAGITAPLLALAAFVFAALPAAALAPSLSITPTSGGQFRTFTITGQGFEVGAALMVTFTSPDGEEIRYASGGDGIRAGLDGRIRLTLVPAVDFAGSTAGRWTVTICQVDLGDCVSRSFTVSS